MDCLLIYPPFADPTQSYISLPLLKGFLKGSGYDSVTVDLNAEGFNYLLSEPFLDQAKKKLHDKYRELNGKTSLTFNEALHYEKILNALKIFNTFIPLHEKIICTFKKKELFFDPARYFNDTILMDGYIDALNALTFPFEFNFNKASHFLLPWSFAQLDNYTGRSLSLLDDFYKNFIKKITAEKKPPDVIGISLTFITQIPETFYLCRLMKNYFPETIFVLGGACTHQIMNNIPDDDKKKICSYFDTVCLYEGENFLKELLSKYDKIKKSPSDQEKNRILASIPNILYHDKNYDKIVQGTNVMTDITSPPLPDFSDYDLDDYLAPSRLLLYNPSRGCYWRKCSFCNYGFYLKQEYREIPPATAASQIKELKKKYNVENFYISCDVISPSYAGRFAQELIDQDVNINWHCDLKIEKNYTDDLCSLLYRSGFKMAAFGIESGSDRVLKIIDKGTDRQTIRNINRNFYKNKIGTQWMTFTGHPGETYKDAIDTLKFIEEESGNIELFITGEFGLTPHSQIACKPEKYGVKNIYYTGDDSFKLYPLFENKRLGLSAEHQETINSRLDILSEKFNLNHYPWAGAISTHHTLLYFIEYGQGSFKKNAFKNFKKQNKTDNRQISVQDKEIQFEKPKFSIEKIEKIKYDFINNFLQKALKPVQKNNGLFEAGLSEKSYLKESGRIQNITPMHGRGR